VDGKTAELVRVDHALIGVPLATAGTHQVTLAYRPPVVAEARLVSIATWATVILATIVSAGLALREGRRRG
jgi:hypothetical protein